MTDEQIRLEDEALNKRTLIALGWRWEPLPGKNAGGNLYQPNGTRYRFALNELAAWSVVAPQVVTDWCEAGKMLEGYHYAIHHYAGMQPILAYSVEIETDKSEYFEGKADTFPRAACLAICAMLETRNSAEKAR